MAKIAMRSTAWGDDVVYWYLISNLYTAVHTTASQAELPRVYLKEGKYHTRLFRGPSTNGMKK